MLHLNIIKVKTPEEMGKAAADEFEAVICRKPACVMGLATGSTPLPLYRELIAREQAGKIDFSRVRSANLDEYKGLALDHPQSYRRFMQENLFDHISIKPENTIVPDGLADDIPSMCRAYERKIEDWGGVDIQLLGIGHDGHIGFNEPGESFDKQVHCVNLTESTIEANKRFFASAEDVPKQAALYFLPETVVFVLQLPAALAFIRYTVFSPRHHTIRFFKIRHIKLGLFLLFDRKQKLCCLLIPVQ